MSMSKLNFGWMAQPARRSVLPERDMQQLLRRDSYVEIDMYVDIYV